MLARVAPSWAGNLSTSLNAPLHFSVNIPTSAHGGAISDAASLYVGSRSASSTTLAAMNFEWWRSPTIARSLDTGLGGSNGMVAGRPRLNQGLQATHNSDAALAVVRA
jgi:hypothetical protein